MYYLHVAAAIDQSYSGTFANMERNRFAIILFPKKCQRINSIDRPRTNSENDMSNDCSLFRTISYVCQGKRIVNAVNVSGKQVLICIYLVRDTQDQSHAPDIYSYYHDHLCNNFLAFPPRNNNGRTLQLPQVYRRQPSTFHQTSRPCYFNSKVMQRSGIFHLTRPIGNSQIHYVLQYFRRRV